MAYVFSKINQALNPEEQQTQGTNIFAEGQGGSDPSQGGEGGAPGQPQVKTSTEGDLSGAGGGGSATTSENMPQDMKKQDTRVMKRNLGKVSTPDFTKQIGEKLSTADQNLQNESNAYMEKATQDAQTYDVDDQTIDSAITGDEGATGRVTGALQGVMVDYDDFTPETQYQFDEVNDLSSSAGLQNLLKNEARGRLSAKELEFDRGILERSPEFLAIREALKGQQSTLSDKAGKLVEDNTSNAQAAIDKAIEDAKLKVETGLGSRRDELISANEAEAADINKRREEMRKAGIPKEVQDQILGIRNELASEYDDSLRMDELLLQAGIDPAQYLSFAGDVGMADMVDEQEATRFNRILQLLGKGGDTWSAGAGAGDDFSLDAAKVREAIVGKAQAERERIDTDLRSEEKRIMDAIRARVAQENENRSRAYEDYKAMTIQKMKDANQGMNWDLVDFNQFFGGPGGALTFDQLINQSEAEKLNQILKGLGDPRKSYKAGAGAGDFGRADTAAIQAYLDSLKYQPGSTPSMSNNANPVTKGDSSNWTDAVKSGTQKGSNNNNPTDTIKQIVTNPVGTVKKSIPKKLRRR